MYVRTKPPTANNQYLKKSPDPFCLADKGSLLVAAFCVHQILPTHCFYSNETKHPQLLPRLCICVIMSPIIVRGHLVQICCYCCNGSVLVVVLLCLQLDTNLHVLFSQHTKKNSKEVKLRKKIRL